MSGTQAADLFRIPDHCPVCAGPVALKNAFLYCQSRSCPAKAAGSIKVWIKRLGILQWGDALVDSLTDPDNPRVNCIGDLYRLTVDDIAMCCSGVKVAKKCYEILHASKSVTLELMLASLNIPNLAVSTATDIVQSGYDSVQKIAALCSLSDDLALEALTSVPNVGEITARQVLDGLREKMDTILDLESVIELRKPSSGPLSGKLFCITGATSKPRKTVEKMIMDAGGVVKSSVGAGLSYLVTNDSDTTSSKMKSAKKHGVTVISEVALYNMMGTSQ